MASTAAPDEPKKPSSTRARKATPRSRTKKSATAEKEKKAPTPRRRASPRNLRKAQGAEQEKNNREEQGGAAADAPPAAAAPPVKEEKEQRQETSQEAAASSEEKTEADPQREAATKEEAELPPAHDTQLRRNYLQRVWVKPLGKLWSCTSYRQLQSTHPSQDDAVIRQIATNVEMESCQKSATRSQYVATMEQEIHKLMQFEMEQANASLYSNDAQGFGNVQTDAQVQPAVSGEMQGRYSQHQISQSRSYEYAQALAKAQEQEHANSFSRSSSFSTPRQSMNGGDTSFQSLMGNQTQGYASNGMQQQQQHSTPSRAMSMQNLHQMNMGNPTSSMTPPTSQSFSTQSNVSEMAGQGIPRTMMEAHQQQGNFQMQQQPIQQPGSIRPQPRVTNLEEFSAQIQHLDKSTLIDLLWSQRGALARWQNQAKQLELQLAAQRNAASNMGSPGFNSPYSSPMVGGGSFVNSNVSVEAEMQRARDRSASRMAHHQQMPPYSYGQQSNPTTDSYAQASGNWGENPQLYWERIRALKAAYADKLRAAQRALAHNTAPPNSVYSMKAQSMMQNIGLVLNILNEQPTNVQPRKFEVLNSIERFMQMSVIPIVQKVLSSGAVSQVTTGSPAPGSSSAMTASVATYSPGPAPTRDNNFGMDSNSRQDTDHQYSGTRWTPSSSIFNGGDTSRQPSRGVFTDVEPKSSTGGHNTTAINTPTQMMDGLTAVENSPSNAGEDYEPSNYVPMRAESDKVTNQPENAISQSRVYEAPTITPKGLCTSSLPAIESRPSAITEAQLSSVIPGGHGRDGNSSKLMDGSVDDTLNEFSELAYMGIEFGDPVAEGLVKENNPSNVVRKRGIEDV
ncbi:hypothetical protein PHYPSEUDO_010754 [Phytophthora pseudosyringae]|uniref:Uncharacterized protein n=1 Tax=Phytophthora pseudosyringae TaxID=221518 RepID=A0A8T1V9H8_9STRA|nr:hypothetical protein PHYPSEUDO_010754 [Phytophthora pseudosyringae]